KVRRGQEPVLSATTSYLDGFGRVSSTSNTVGVTTAITYDSCDRKSFESYPYLGTAKIGSTYEYDGLGRLLKKTNPGGSFVKYDYSGMDVDIRDENGHVTHQDWSAF